MRPFFAHIKDFFLKNDAEIAARNWHLLRYLSPTYLVCLFAYYFVVCRSQPYPLQSLATAIAIGFQILYVIVVFCIRKENAGPTLTKTMLAIFGVSIAAFTIYLGTVVFRDSSALLFPLILIMLVQFYTLAPANVVMILFVCTGAFLGMSYYYKVPQVFLLDVLSTVVALSIACVSYYTAIKGKADNSKKQLELHYLSMHDSLTGLLNRSAFCNAVTEKLENPECGGYVLIIIDLDKFKNINDVNGHLAGDRVLKSIGNALNTSFGIDGNLSFAGRFGGDEFLIFISNINDNDTADGLLKIFFSQVAALSESYGFNIACSAGGVFTSGNTATFDSLFAGADENLYAAKEKGGGMYILSSCN